MPKRADPQALVGQRVVKDFFDGEQMRPFEGKVTEYHPEENWYNVTYEDGDMEDLDRQDVEALITRAKQDPPPPAKASDGASKRKGRPSRAAAPAKRTKKAAPAAARALLPEPDAESLPPTGSDSEAAEEAASEASDPEFDASEPEASESESDLFFSGKEDSASDDEEEGFFEAMGRRRTPRGTAPAAPPRRTPRQHTKLVLLKADDPDDDWDSAGSEEEGGDDEAAAGPSSAPPRLTPRQLTAGEPAPAPASAPAPSAEAAATAAPQAVRQKKKPVAAAEKPKVATNSKKSKSPADREPKPPPRVFPELESVEVNKRYEYAAGAEPWRDLVRKLKMTVNLTPVLTPSAIKIFHECKEKYYRRYRSAEVEENIRVEAHADTNYVVNGKKLSKRPDRVTESWMKRTGTAIYQEKRVGNTHGIKVNQRFYSRAEVACAGMHLPPVCGISYAQQEVTGLGFPVAMSVVCAGWYQDDADAGEELIYTGEGGNDLLGTRVQVADQTLVRGNAALVGNIKTGLPVRVIRKNKDPLGIYGCVLIYDGLYNVVEYWNGPGKKGHTVYNFRLVRCPGQEALSSEAVKFGGISAPKTHIPLSRPGIVDLDISGGKEALPIAAVNETDDNELPPCSDLVRVPEETKLQGNHRGITTAALEIMQASEWKPTVEYITSYVYTPGITAPAPATLPAEFQGKDPHQYIMELNHGRLPYVESRNGKVLQLREALPVVYECGPWSGCPLGRECPQAATQRSLKYRLEIFKTLDGRGWGVRSLDMIPQFAHICDYFGDVYKAEDFIDIVESGGHDAAYSMDMAARPDRDWQGERLDNVRSADDAEYVVCGLHRRNIAAFLNHSCEPNCFVQPVLSDHHDVKMPKISIFASEDIAPFTQLTYDYGIDYVDEKFAEGCKCRAAECVSKTPVQQQPQRSPCAFHPEIAAALTAVTAAAEEGAEEEGWASESEEEVEWSVEGGESE